MSNLAQDLTQFIGTSQWYRHPLNRNMLFTDGIKHLIENGGQHGCFWLLDIIATEGMALHQSHQMVVVKLSVDRPHGDDSLIKATLTMDDGNGNELLRRTIHTDMQHGDWTIWLVDNTALLPSEY